VGEFMTRNPIVLSVDDTCAVAAATIREYRLKNLPVVEHQNGRKLAGFIGVRRLMAFVLKGLALHNEKDLDGSKKRVEPGLSPSASTQTAGVLAPPREL